MTAAELRSLLERVEKHGGTLTVFDHPGHSAWHEIGWMTSRGVPEVMTLETVDGDDEYLLVGVLKRDLETRGHQWATSWGTWADGTVAHGATVETGYRKSVTERGDSELEAVLKAWLAAAEAEGWTA